MPRTELPSESSPGVHNWVEWVDKVTSGGRFEVKKAVVNRVTTSPDGTVVQELDSANEDRQRIALWYQAITNWSWAERGIPVPSQNPGGVDIIWDVLSDLDDYFALAEATQDLLEKVSATPTQRKTARGSSTTS